MIGERDSDLRKNQVADDDASMLPNEIWINILKRMTLRELQSLSRIDSRFAELALMTDVRACCYHNSFGDMAAVKLFQSRGNDELANVTSRLPLRECFTGYLLRLYADRNDHDGMRSILSSGTNNEPIVEALCYAVDSGNIEAARFLLAAEITSLHHGDNIVLRHACKMRKIEFVRLFVEKGADVSAVNDECLIEAIRAEDSELAIYLLDNGANARARQGYGLRIAAEIGNLGIIQELLERGAAAEESINNAMLISVSNGRCDVVEALIQAGADIGFLNNSAIVWASHRGYFDIFKLLHEHGADLNAQDQASLFWPAVFNHSDITDYIASISMELSIDDQLIVAASRNDVELVESLLKQGADINARENQALILAVKNLHYDATRVLLDNGADVHVHDNCPMILSIEKGDLKLTQLLLEKGADVHMRDDYPLLLASKGGMNNILKLLLEKGADVHARDNASLVSAVDYGKTDVVITLIEAGADLHCRSDLPLRLAAGRGYFEIVQMLLDAGATVNACLPYTEDPVLLACRDGHVHVIKLLMDHGAIVDNSLLIDALKSGCTHQPTILFLLETLGDFEIKQKSDAVTAAITRSSMGVLELLIVEEFVMSTDLHRHLSTAIRNEKWPAAERLMSMGARLTKEDSWLFAMCCKEMRIMDMCLDSLEP